jgi:tripartite ATP-independent transporter DctP family solute receptor
MGSNMTRREVLKSVGVAAAAAAVVPGFPAIVKAGTPAKYVLRLSHTHATGDTALDVFAVKFKELAAAKSGGQVDIQIYPNGQLGQEREIVQQVQQGLCDFMASGTAIWGTVAPKIQILDLPFLFRDYDHIHKSMDGEVGQALAKYVEERTGARPLAYYDSFGFRSVVTRNKEVKSIDDLKGLKLRTLPSPIYVKAIELMGASPTPMAFGEIYTSLQTNVIDGYEHDANTTLMQKFFEVTKYFALTQHISGVLGIVASAKSIDALPPDMKKAVTDAAKEAAVFQRKRAPEEDEKSMVELKKKGMVINIVDRKPFAARAEPFLMSFSKEVQADDLVKKILAVK